jgi:hypothetical protein
MTEADWLDCEDPERMLAFLRREGRASDRKLRLFACACCRGVWRLFNGKRLRAAVEASERYADGDLTAQELQQVRRSVEQLADRAFRRHVRALPWTLLVQGKFARQAAVQVASADIDEVLESTDAGLAPARSGPDYQRKRVERRHDQAELLRDLFGNPFRPVTIDPVWLAWDSGVVPNLAQAVYDERAFDRLPILADALEDAGCTDTNLLGHLRGPGPHFLGCWAADAVLARE